MAVDVKLIARIIAKADTKRGTERAARDFDKLAKDLKKFGARMAVITGALVAMGIATKKAFEFTEQGAQVIQLTESFDRLGISIESLRSAAGGTMSDMDLMAATNKALAGTQDELRDKTQESIPALLEMSRVAVKLDPTLGSVEHAFMSLITGIKKGQPLLIDNTNAIVSVAAANERWAKANNTSVREMTAAQKQMALLEETQRAGLTMLEQVGGSVDSATDAWARYRAEMKNNTNALKAFAADAAMPFVETLAETARMQREFRESGREIPNDYGKYARAVMNYAEEQKEAAKQTEISRKSIALYSQFAEVANTETIDLGDNVYNSRDVFDQYSQAIDGARQSSVDYATAQREAADAAAEAEVKFNNAAAALGDMSIASFVAAQLDILRQSVKDGTLSTEDFANAQEALLTKFGLLTEVERSGQGAIDGLTQAFINGKLSPEAYAMALENVKNKVDALDGSTVTVDFNFNIPTLPDFGKGGGGKAFAAGGVIDTNAPVWVGENGPEQIVGGAGARVITNQQTQNTYNITNNIATSDALTRLLRDQQRANRSVQL